MSLQSDLEQLALEFKNIPDREKDFPSLQDRLEDALKRVAVLTDAEREPLLPVLQDFQNYLKEHMEIIQQEAGELQLLLNDKATHRQAARAYKQFR